MSLSKHLIAEAIWLCVSVEEEPKTVLGLNPSPVRVLPNAHEALHETPEVDMPKLSSVLLVVAAEGGEQLEGCPGGLSHYPGR